MKKVLRLMTANGFIILLFLIVLPFRLVHIQDNLTSITNFRQAQTATFALNFYKHGINFLQTELDIFGKGPERFLTLEFPLYEALTAVLYKTFFVADMWGRVVSVAAGFLGALYLFKLVYLLLNNKIISLLSALFFLTMPLNMVYQQDFVIEPLVISFLLAGLYYFVLFTFKKDNRSYLLYILFISLGFIQKGLYGPFWLLPMAVFYFREKNNSYKKMAKFILMILLPLLTLFLWQTHVNLINKINGNEYFTTANKSQIEWNIGTLADRLSWPLWEYRLSQMEKGIFLKPGILIFFIGLFAAKKFRYRSFFYSWLTAAIIYFLALFRIQSHNYYQMVMTPVFSFFMAAGLWWLGSQCGKLMNRHKKTIVFLLIASFYSVYIWRAWRNSQWGFITDLNWYKRLQMVGQSTPQNTYGIFVNPYHDWSSVYTYYPKLKMKIYAPEDIFPEKIAGWKQAGYTYIILHNYRDYPGYFKEIKTDHSLEFLDRFPKILELEDFRVYSLGL